MKGICMERKDNFEKKNKASEKYIVTKRNKKINVKIIEICEHKDSPPEIIACRITEGIFKFVIIHWYRRIIPGYCEAGFFYITPHCQTWEMIPLVSWMSKYKTKEDFLIDYPQLIELFGSNWG